MANNGGRHSSAPGNNSSLILGILIGMVIGLAVAGGVAWHLSKRPSSFTSKEQHETQAASNPAPSAAAQKPPVTATAAKPGQAASGVNDGKPRFEFYRILTDKENPPPKGSHTATAPKEPKDNAKTSAASAYFLQAGSFASADDAGKLKAKLALLGMEANVQPADVPGKGTYYRVRLGPYRNADEANKANATLKQNQINDAAVVHGQ